MFFESNMTRAYQSVTYQTTRFCYMVTILNALIFEKGLYLECSLGYTIEGGGGIYLGGGGHIFGVGGAYIWGGGGWGDLNMGEGAY